LKIQLFDGLAKFGNTSPHVHAENMKQIQEHTGIGSRIIAGFLVVLALMASLTVIGLRYIAETNERLKSIVENNNIKTELATQMQTALRERALSMHALSVLTDPFDKDAEIQRFNSYASVYLDARERLEKMPLSKQEHETLDRIRGLTRSGFSEVQTVVDMSMNGGGPEIFDRIRNSAIPKQRKIAEEVNALIALQRDLTNAAVRNAEQSYNQVRDLMTLLGMIAVLAGLLIALYVIRRVSQQARQLVTQALYDPLTGLPNRSLLQDRLEQTIVQSRRGKRSFGVVLMDLNRFKEVNDTLGHNVGDELLWEVGKRLRQTVRAEDTVARMGGDEFVIILHELTEADVPAFANKLQTALEPPFLWEGQSIDVSASIGFALFPLHAEDCGSLIRYADIAMYMAKRSGRHYALYAPDQAQPSRSTLSLKGELREAIQSGQLTLHYQPKIDHQAYAVAGLEALVRWNHPRHGLLPPDKFIPLAEELGLMESVTQWVLKTALDQLALLHAKGYPVSMGVNLSARSLHDLELPALISSMLAESGVPAEYLTLEITESAVMSHPGDALAILTKLDRMGITLAIDDFGTGYSSMAHLRQLPVDEIKIDKSFVVDMEENENDAVIVRSIIDLAHNLGLKVVAEGVETKDAWITLSVLGCDLSQGHYLSTPLPSERLLEWLEKSSAPMLASLRPPRIVAISA
jgi:diguanylate cyclase (GGDEF)-like protein